MIKNRVSFRKVKLPGENIYIRLRESGISVSGLARALRLSRPMLRYHVFHLSRPVLRKLSTELRQRAVLLSRLADDVDRLLS